MTIASTTQLICFLVLASTLVGGSDVAAELDAKRAINQASRLAAAI